MRRLSYFVILLLTWTLSATPMIGLAPSTGSTWVFMSGYINRYGTESVGGWVGAWAEIDQWAEVRAFWVKPQILPIPGSYTFHYAKLVNTLIIKLSFEGKDFYILGTWDVFKVTLVHDAHRQITKVVEVIAQNARGELSVTSLWKDFTISIEGVNLIEGKIICYRIRMAGPIPKGDVTGSGTAAPDGEVDILDLMRVAKAYGSTPGLGNYAFDLDLNFDFAIDIQDLTTLAFNFGKKY